MSGSRETVETEGAPAAIGPYAQGVVAGGLVFTAGQIGVDPETGDFAGPDVAAQADRALSNLAAVLEAAGSGLDRVVKTTVFLADMDDYEAFNEVYGRRFASPYPARSAVEAAELPGGARVEIEAVASAPSGAGGRDGSGAP